MSDILHALNDAQKEAVTATEGYVRVIAGAGSGKTRALTHRYAYLINDLGISPSNVLCITFTNKAANEMKQRIKKMLGQSFDTSFVATLHSFCTRILREDISKLLYPENFIVIDNVDQKKILEEIYEELGIRMDTASFRFMQEQIRIEKNQFYYLDYLTDPEFDFQKLQYRDKREAIIFRYIEKQKKYFALDFSDLINFTIYLFDHYPDTEEKWQKRLHYVMVDEFQDITAKEFKLIRRLTAVNRNWFVVGDPDQNIYEWRGSQMGVLLDFDQKVRPCRTILMGENYRSTPEILAAANSLIEKNRVRIKKELFTKLPHGPRPVYFHGKNDREEIAFITGEIQRHVEKGGSYSDIAVLYRSNHVSCFIEQGFLASNIPYAVYGGIGFYERTEIKDVLSYLRLIASGDDLSFQRIVNVPRRKFGKSKMQFLKDKAQETGASLYDTLKCNLAHPSLRGCAAADFVSAIESLREEAKTLPVSELLQRVLLETKYELYIRESGDIERLDNIGELLSSIVMQEREYGEPLSLDTFLQNMALLRDADGNSRKDTVKIMTIHTAKGLEFDTVFLCGLTERIFPSARALEERKENALEEERRLAFVALTRAKKMLYLSESEGYGAKGYSKVPSRFLQDIDRNLIDTVGDVPPAVMEEYAVQVKEYKQQKIYSPGTQVRHKAFGEGIIEQADEKSQTYYIRFLSGVKPIRFDYQGLTLVH